MWQKKIFLVDYLWPLVVAGREESFSDSIVVAIPPNENDLFMRSN